VSVFFENQLSEPVELFWDGKAAKTGNTDLSQLTTAFAKDSAVRFRPQGDPIEPKRKLKLMSYPGHAFVAVDGEKQVRWAGKVTAKLGEEEDVVIS
jgi:hypothetical protein